jgi:hypothetical protein
MVAQIPGSNFQCPFSGQVQFNFVIQGPPFSTVGKQGPETNNSGHKSRPLGNPWTETQPDMR